MSKTKVSVPGASHISHRRAGKNSAKTTSNQNLAEYNTADKYRGLLHSNGTLLKVGVGMYAINQTHSKNAYNRCAKKMQKVKKLQSEFEAAQRYAGQAQNSMDAMGNVAGSAFERTMYELKLKRIEKKATKYRNRIERGKKLGRMIGGVMGTMGMVARTSMMQKAMDSPSGTSRGIDREKLAVSMGVVGDGVAHVNEPDTEGASL